MIRRRHHRYGVPQAWEFEIIEQDKRCESIVVDTRTGNFPYCVMLWETIKGTVTDKQHHASGQIRIWCDGARIDDDSCGVGIVIIEGATIRGWSGHIDEPNCSSSDAELVAICVAYALASRVIGNDIPAILTDSCAYATGVLDGSHMPCSDFADRFQRYATGIRMSYVAAHHDAGNILADKLAKIGAGMPEHSLPLFRNKDSAGVVVSS